MNGRHRIAFPTAAATALLLAPACASTPGAGDAEPAAGEVADASGSFRASLSFPFAQETDAEGLHSIRVSIEGPIAVYCHVWPHETELGVTALRLSEGVFENLSEAEDVEIPERQLAAVEAGAIGDRAYQSLKTAFRLTVGEETGVGLMKVAVANAQGRGIACQHWTAGQVEVFDRVFEELVRSFELREPGPEPYYSEIMRIRADGVVVGVSTTRFTRDDQGDVQGVAEMSLTIPTSPRELTVHHSKGIDWSDPSGTLINAYEFASDLESEHTNLSLVPKEEGGWRVSGVHEDEAVEEDLEYDRAIDSILSESLVMKYALVPRGERTNATLVRWLPDADPTRLTALRFQVDAEDARRLTMEAAGLEMRAERDDEGLPEVVEMEAGGIAMTFERIYQDGEI